MRHLDARIAALEAADLSRRSQGRLVLIAPRGRLTAEQAQAAAARREGRELLVIELVAAGGPPENSGRVQA